MNLIARGRAGSNYLLKSQKAKCDGHRHPSHSVLENNCLCTAALRGLTLIPERNLGGFHY
jgi:hypothetical protein